MKPKIELMLDSGAFSAWKRGQPIDINAYCDFLFAHQDIIASYVNLDVIDDSDPHAGARASFENYLIMRKRGLNPMPVFHAGEHISWLDEMLNAGADYIGLSGSSIISGSAVDPWYDVTWSRIVTSEGKPVVKAHAFGEGRHATIKSYPWYSVDSTNWAYTAGKLGQTTLPDGSVISMRGDRQHTRSRPHIDRIEGQERAILLGWAESLGVAPDILARDENAMRAFRFYLLATYYRDFDKSLETDSCKRFRTRGFFDRAQTRPAIDFPQTKFFLVSSYDTACWPAMAVARTKRLLCSYFYLRAEQATQRMRDFVINPLEAVRAYEPWAKFLDIYQKSHLLSTEEEDAST